MERMYNASCQYPDCCACSAAESFSARIHNRMDTIAVVVSIFVIALSVGLRVWL
ncbi:MAG: hypothetical protein J6B95_04545 [Oscillospiraceae bacterium]|nr:hypothetical protein [Oscillospiraceae bacterium]